MTEATTSQGSVTTTYGYDGSGNTTSIKSTTGLSKTLSYDAQNRLIQVTVSGSPGLTVTQSYNAEGQRASYSVTQTNGLTQTQSFTYWNNTLQQRVVVSDTVTGGITSTTTTTYTDVFVYDNTGAPLELIRTTNGTTSRYGYIEDGRGNVVALVDTSGTVQDRYTYDLWGKLVSSSEAVQQPFLYAGYWYDRELGWYWLSVREYDPVLERFLQPDPSGIEGIRSYVYVHDDPIDFTDPGGFGDPCFFSINWFGGRAAIGIPGAVCSSPAPAILHGADQAADAAYQTLIGQYTDVLRSRASVGDKAWAVVNLVLLVVPQDKLLEGVRWASMPSGASWTGPLISTSPTQCSIKPQKT